MSNTISQTVDTPLAKAFRAVRDTVREPHPFERNTSFLKPHRVPWQMYFTRLGRTASFLVPAAVVVFGWPMAAKWLVNKSNGVYDEKPTRRSR